MTQVMPLPSRMLRSLVPARALEPLRAARTRYLRDKFLADLYSRYGAEAVAGLPQRTLAELFPGRAAAVRLSTLRLGEADNWELPAGEMLALAGVTALVAPSRVFEFGTYRGVSTSLIAENLEGSATLTTLDLDPAERVDYFRKAGSAAGNRRFEPGERFRGTPLQERITQLLGNSQTMDFSLLHGQFDLVFLDGDHTYEAVLRDTQTASRLLRAGGVMLWDDYTPECVGVIRALNQLSARAPIFRLGSSRFCICTQTGGMF